MSEGPLLNSNVRVSKRCVMFGRQLAASNMNLFPLTASVSTFVSFWNTAYNTEIALKDKQCGVYKANC